MLLFFVVGVVLLFVSSSSSSFFLSFFLEKIFCVSNLLASNSKPMPTFN